jgi:hypothetical protein
MSNLITQKQKEEISRCGEGIYERVVKPSLRKTDDGKFVVIHVDSGDYMMGRSQLHVSLRMRRLHPEGWFHTIRVGRDFVNRVPVRARKKASTSEAA